MDKGANNTYFGNIKESLKSILLGLKLSIRHFFEAKKSRQPHGIHEKEYFEQKTGIFTLQYPKESIPVPDNGRYRLHNEIEDCIVCDKCAKICPVDCIDIEPIKALEPIGETSDGTTKRLYAAKFDIDMGKCCFCGLCTTVCPTECLTMTKTFDFSEFDVADHVYAFAEMTPIQILEKKQELEKANREKELAKAASAEGNIQREKEQIEKSDANSGPKPAFKPRMPVKGKISTDVPEKQEDDAKKQALALMKAKSQKTEEAKTAEDISQNQIQKPKPVFKPRVPVKPNLKEQKIEDKEDKEHNVELEKSITSDEKVAIGQGVTKEKSSSKTGKSVFKPKIPRPKISGNNPETPKEPEEKNEAPASQNQVLGEHEKVNKLPSEDKLKPVKPVFKPKIPVKKRSGSEKESQQTNIDDPKKPLSTQPLSEATKSGEHDHGADPEKDVSKAKPRPVFKPRVPINKKNKEGEE